MVYLNSVVKIADNSGANFIKCFKVYKKSRRLGGSAGDIILGSIKSIFIKQDKKLQKGDLSKAIIINSKRNKKRFSGHFISSDRTSVILLKLGEIPQGTRIHGPVYYELRNIKNNKLISIANTII